MDEETDAASEAVSQFMEAEAPRLFGPPEMRARKNRRYVRRLVRKFPEQQVRSMLKALSALDDPQCCANLREHDLDAEPLEEIICPFDLLGLSVTIAGLPGGLFQVDLGEAYDTVGSGGQFVLESLGDEAFRIVEQTGGWIA